MFFWKEFIKSEKLLQILMKLLNPQILFLNPKKIYNPRIVAKSRKIFCKSEKIFWHVLLVPAVNQRQSLFPPFCHIQNGGGAGWG